VPHLKTARSRNVPLLQDKPSGPHLLATASTPVRNQRQTRKRSAAARLAEQTDLLYRHGRPIRRGQPLDDLLAPATKILSPSLNTYMSKLYTQPLGTIPNMEIGNSCIGVETRCAEEAWVSGKEVDPVNRPTPGRCRMRSLRLFCSLQRLFVVWTVTCITWYIERLGESLTTSSATSSV